MCELLSSFEASAQRVLLLPLSMPSLLSTFWITFHKMPCSDSDLAFLSLRSVFFFFFFGVREL